MQVLFFSKAFQTSDAADLIRRGHALGADGYDLAVRPGYAVGPDNIEALPNLVHELRSAGLAVPMITAPGDFLHPADPRAKGYLRAMAAADVHLIKLGYYPFDRRGDYWAAVDAIRRDLAGWERLGREYGVTICYHTHSGDCMGLNASALMHLIRGFDSRYIGGYLDPGHLLACGEPFEFAAAVVSDQLRIVGLKDSDGRRFVRAGQGQVAWDRVFAVLIERAFAGPLSVHAEYAAPSPEAYDRSLPEELTFFKQAVAAAKSRAARS